MHQEEIKTQRDIIKAGVYDLLDGYPQTLIGALDFYNQDCGYKLSRLLRYTAKVMQVSIDTLEAQLAELYPDYKQRWN
jgi:hypothetical protein